MKKDIEIKYEKELFEKIKGLPEFAADFIQSLENSKAIRTRIAYSKDLSIYLRFLLSELEIAPKEDIKDLTIDDVKNIKESDIRSFLSYLNYYTVEYVSTGGNIVKQNYSNSQQGKNRKMASLKTMYSYLSRVYEVFDPTRHIDIKVNNKVEIKNTLTASEIEELITLILNDLPMVSEREKSFHKKYKDRNVSIVLMLAYTGIRVSELVALDIQDINIKEGTFIITRKGGDQEKAYLADKIIPHLDNYLSKRKLRLDVDINYKDALFLSNRRKRISTRQINYILDKYATLINLDNVSPHTLRRSFGQEIYEQTSDIQLTADFLGHKSTEITRKFYAKPSEARKAEKIKGFEYK